MKKGVLLVNLGTPDKPEVKEIRHFLKYFLADQRVVAIPKAVWLPILYGPILMTRPKKVRAAYREIWTAAGSPLKVYMQQQVAQLQAQLPDYQVFEAMSYSQPFLTDVLGAIQETGIDDLTIVPMYPQYSTTTTMSIYDVVAKFYLKQSNMPTIHFVKDFYRETGYIDLLVTAIEQRLQDQTYDEIIVSYHGIPRSYVLKGDPYQNQCETTTALLQARLPEQVFRTTYQSKFGPNEWLTPATSATMKTLAQEGIKKILVITPGFVADCLETIEEIDVENRAYFMNNHGEQFDYIRPFNDDPRFTALLAQIVRQR
ncbi:ferrochelatase [Latilactobacillus graminis]|uniref:Coproporphyrin III ferrochelatase n=2 Tax=Latilactobacillus graminis TaxID=60519 RepID=A0AA89HZJ7_9LACO|nr:ferrochelatase [Latilactobacillus graminis]KRM20662.1 ferrochelatase [Latilactobacillus graminis DSM 20719]QFP79969.1 ferrochelatase [Latilactobacillus graminis]